MVCFFLLLFPLHCLWASFFEPLAFVAFDTVDMSNLFLTTACWLLLISFNCSSDVVVFLHYYFCFGVSRITCPSNFFRCCKFNLLREQSLYSICEETWKSLDEVCRKSCFYLFLLININLLIPFVFFLYCPFLLGCISISSPREPVYYLLVPIYCLSIDFLNIAYLLQYFFWCIFSSLFFKC